ncbi:MAG: SDR family oxidoreductase [Gammaproteobacteria bacterium]|nr:SDR family oxidoreductase [Gammaproteobacteria bacterium]
MSGRLAGKVALVTGGSSGLGAGIVQRYLEEGATVWNADLNAPALPSARYIPLDVCDEAQWEQVLAAIVAESGGLHVLVNNAGIFTSSPVDETPVADFRRVLDVNVIGVFLGCKHAVRIMKTGGGGAIINLSSVTGLRGQVGGAAYGASKAAVKMLSKTVALEGAAHAIRCNSIHPGIIESPMLRAAMAASGNPEAVERHINGYLPMGYIGDPVQDIGNMALYLASDESRYITGTEMVVDGGMITGLPS